MYVHGGRHEKLETREERFEYAIDKMLGTVFGGAITTCGAGFMMFFCIQTFFTKMATLLTMTIIFALCTPSFGSCPSSTGMAPPATSTISRSVLTTIGFAA